MANKVIVPGEPEGDPAPRPKRDFQLTVAKAEAILNDPTHQGVCALNRCEKYELAGDIVYLAGQIAAYDQFKIRATQVLAAAIKVNIRPDADNLARLKAAIADCPEMRDASAAVEKLEKASAPPRGSA